MNTSVFKTDAAKNKKKTWDYARSKARVEKVAAIFQVREGRALNTDG